MKYFYLLLASLFLCSAPPASAEEKKDENYVEFIYPLVTRRPIVENEAEFKIKHLRTKDGQETEFVAEGGFRILPFWEAVLEVPAVLVHDRGGATRGGLGDIGIENRFLVFKSIPHQAQVVLGFEVDAPTGSKHRGLGGEWGVEPYASGGVKFGRVNLVGSVGHEWGHLNARHNDEKERAVKADFAAGYELSKLFAALLEVNTVTLTKGGEDEGLHNKTQVYLTPGINIMPIEEMTIRLGVQIPVTRAKEFYHQVHAGMSWFFD
ncbi:MAG TPA: transporter [Candidatus Binatia bacterium]